MIRYHASIAGNVFCVAFLLFLCSFCLTSAKTGPTHGKVVVCYISTWAVYRPGRGAYSIENFVPSLCTHAIYAFAGLDITQSAIKSLDPWQDLKDDYGKGGYERLTGLKRSHPHLKVSLAIGGWNEGSHNYSLLVDSPEQRSRFVKQVTSFIKKYDFDGLDLDWEYPTQRGGKPRDRENFVALTKELRNEFDNHGLLLTSAIGAAKNVIDQAYDIRQLSRYLDFLHIMCYDYGGSWDKLVGYNAPLKTLNGGILSVQFTIDYLLKLGAPSEKLVMGLPFYGRTFKTPGDGNIGDATDGTAFQGPYTREDGFLGYNEICSILANKSSGWTTEWHGETAQALARSERDPLSGLVNVVTFDNSRSIANKVKFALSKNLAGLMIWSVDTDDFLGECGDPQDIYLDFKYVTPPRRVNGNYPLLRTVNEAIPLAEEELEKEQENHDHKHDQDQVHENDNDHNHEHEDEHDETENEIPHGTNEDHKQDNSKASSLTWPKYIILSLSFSWLIFS